MNNIKKMISDAEKKLISKNYKITKPRSDLMLLLANVRKPLTAVEIIDLGKKQNLDRVSVYRILDVFKKTGIVHSVGDAGYIFCSHQAQVSHDDHLFLVCDNCSSVEEIQMTDKLKSNMFLQINSQSQFQAKGQIQIAGLCLKCI